MDTLPKVKEETKRKKIVISPIKKAEKASKLLIKEKERGMVGQRYGAYVVLELLGFNKSRRAEYLCLCDCGNKKIVQGYNLRFGRSYQCLLCYRKVMSKRSAEMNERSVLRRKRI